MVLEQIAIELGEPLCKVAMANQKSSESDWRRVERRHMYDAAAELIDYVASAVPPGQREVLILRAYGNGWREVARMLPGRVYYSLADDWRAGLMFVWKNRGDVVRRLI
jgi:hypothetical protein